MCSSVFVDMGRVEGGREGVRERGGCVVVCL